MRGTFINILKNIPTQKAVAPTNTLAHIFSKDYKENFISDLLAALLNPDIMQTVEPLNALLSLVSDLEIGKNEEIEILREHTFDSKRRIDFLIETTYYIIGIENKINSGLEKNQLIDYEKQMSNIEKKKGKQKVLILLCPQSNEIYSDKKLKLGQFKLISYEELVEKFKQIRLNLFENLRATFLMEDFITHMEEYIMQGKNKAIKNIEMWNFQQTYYEDINKLLNTIEISKKQFGDYINERLSALITDNGEWETSIHANVKTPYFQIYKTNWKDAQVHFELINRAEFSPSSMQVVLHTHERGRHGKTVDLYNLQDEVSRYLISKYDTNHFNISYENDQEFDNSISKIFSVLQDVINEFTARIDEGIID
jgi:hypothetical protein